MSEVMELEEYEFKREVNVAKNEVQIKFTNANFSWGYKIKE